ncbi:MAG: branched-chain amino acid ABC transporter ATP-binding protein/permease [Acidimicrobiales bacterium]
MASPAEVGKRLSSLMVAKRNRTGTTILFAIAVLLPFMRSSTFDVGQFQLIAIYILVAVSVNWNFIAGELVLGQSAIFGAGAYTAAILLHHDPAQNALLVILLSAAVSTAVGTVVGIPGLRVGRWYMAMLSFFMIVVGQDLIGQLQSLTNGAEGIVGLPTPVLFGWDITSPRILYFICIAILGLLLLLSKRLFSSSWGPALATMRRSDVLAESVGISRYRTKLTIYTLSGVPCGIAGALFVYSTSLVLPTVFSLNLTILFLAGVVLGGARRFYAPLIGVGILQGLSSFAISLQSYELLVYGVFLLVIPLAVPGGVIATVERLWLFVWGKVAAASGGAGPALETAASALGPAEDVEVDTPIPDGTEELVRTMPSHWTHRPRNETLTIEHVSKAFAGLTALDDVDMVVEPGQVVGLIGGNGSGKTTLLNIICGFYRADAGSVRIGDGELRGMPPFKVARAGVGRTFQTPNLPEDVSVVESLVAAFHWQRRASVIEYMFGFGRSRGERQQWLERAEEFLRHLGIVDIAHHRASDISLGHRRLVEIARALALQPSVLLLDEPASGLSEIELLRFREVVKDLCSSGLSIVLVEHNLPLVTGLADVIYVLDHGRVIASGAPDAIRSDPEVIRSYIGDSAQAVERKGPTRVELAASASSNDSSDNAGLRVEQLQVEYSGIRVLHGVDLAVDSGTVEVVLGPNGAGKTTLLRTISGLVHAKGGRVYLDNTDISRLRPNRTARLGIQHIQEGKRVFRRLSVEDNLTLGEYRLRGETRTFDRESIYEIFPVLFTKRQLLAGSLSGGEQQMLAIAQALLAEPKLLLMDEPSAGLAPGLANQMFDVVSRLRDTGLTVLLVEQIVVRSLAVSDKGSVLAEGKIVFTDTADQILARDDLRNVYFGYKTPADNVGSV